MTVELLQFAVLADLDWLVHGVSTRRGGVSPPPWDSLNLSLAVQDDPERVRTNRARLAAALGVAPEALAWAAQAHGDDVLLVDGGPVPDPAGRADILLTRAPGRVVAVRAADCVPLLVADARRQVVAAAHAGWRGTALQVAAKTVRALAAAFGSDPRDLRAVVGPAIGPCCYEVGPEVAERFAGRPGLLRPGPNGRPHLDLWAANRADLIAAGVPADQVEVARRCTACERDRFFSHRGDGFPSGRFAAAIGLRP